MDLIAEQLFAVIGLQSAVGNTILQTRLSPADLPVSQARKCEACRAKEVKGFGSNRRLTPATRYFAVRGRNAARTSASSEDEVLIERRIAVALNFAADYGIMKIGIKSLNGERPNTLRTIAINRSQIFNRQNIIGRSDNLVGQTLRLHGIGKRFGISHAAIKTSLQSIIDRRHFA